ncbi:MAG TPA: hypothetical protein VG167_08360 [Verrucomicrobiae bacterium]|nr:hypothetical protein [Verrucomicrobiae bacterium]
MSATRKLFPLGCLSFTGPSRSIATKAAFLAWILCEAVAPSTSSQAQTLLYRLNTDSTFQQGCFPPCLCPVMISAPVTGTFLLTPTGSNGLFSTYAVRQVNWGVTINGTSTVVTGSGTYKIGGEFALQQELSLELQVGGTNLERFDSGLVGVSAPFPEIMVAISTNGQYCVDTVFTVKASPMPVPPLHVAFAGAQTVTVSWPASSAPLVLQESSNPTAATWTVVTNAPTVIGNQSQVILSRSPGNKFYRLQPGGN